MNRKIMAVLTALVGLLTGCICKPETSTTAQTETAAQIETALNVYCFQAGKADAFLLWNDDGAVLIDTGNSGYGKTILAKLKALGINRLDYLIITHFDKDHVGGAKKILTDFSVGTVLQTNCPKVGSSAYEKYVNALNEKGIEPVTVRETLRFALGEVVYAVDPPARESYQTDESNNASLIVTVTHGANRLLFTADAEDERMSELLERGAGRCGFVKLPHHGQYRSTLPTLLEQTQPICAVITSSEEEPEDAETLAVLAEAGVETFLTRTAPVLIISDSTGLRIGYDR